MRRALAAVCLVVPLGVAHAQTVQSAQTTAPTAVPTAVQASARLTEQRSQARARQAQLRAQLAALQQEIVAQDAERQSALADLQVADAALTESLHAVDALDEEARAIAIEIERLQGELAQATAELAARRQTLAGLLRAQYTGAVSPWTAVLSGQDAHTIAQHLGYFAYLTQAQSVAVAEVQASLAARARARGQAVARAQALQAVQAETQARLTALQDAQRTQARRVRQLDRELSARRTQADQLLTDVRGLENLLARLESDIAREQQARPQTAAKQELPTQAPGLTDLQGKLPHPVAGEIVGRFGKERPEGGLWRGVVIRAAAGSPVRAIAAGRVVYAQWLTGFGNLMIVDHGAQVLSVYAYNQSLARAVGDGVDAGQILALVGSTGGQVEPGLYFELRVAGAPVNPRLWLQP